MMNETDLNNWKLYFVLDRLKYYPNDFPLYSGMRITEINEIINFLKVSGYIDNEAVLTKYGEKRLKDLYIELKLNRHNKHIYPIFSDLFTN